MRWWWLLGVCACSPSVLRQELPTGQTRGSQIVAFFGEGEPKAYLFSLESPFFELQDEFFRDDLKIEAWISAATPEELGLEPGQLTFAPPNQTGRPLPEPLETYTSRLSGGSFSSWVVEPDPQLKAYLLLGRPADCLTAGGCLVGPFCRSPCEPPLPDLPLPPQAPQFAGCPPDWPAHPESCPWAQDCPEDQVYWPGGGCGQAPPCGALPEGTVYVQQGNVGGDGSRENPFGSLAEAGRASRISLGPGQYRENIWLENQHIEGACWDAQIIGRIDGTGSLANLTIEGTLSGPGRLDAVRIKNSEIYVDRSLSLRSSVITGTTFNGDVRGDDRLEIQGSWGKGIEIIDIHLSVSQSRFSTARFVLPDSPSEASTWTDIILKDTQIQGSNYQTTRLWLDGGYLEPGTRLEDIFILNPTYDGLKFGVGTRATLARIYVKNAKGSGIDAAGGLVDATDLDIEDTQPMDGTDGRGLNVAFRGSLTATRVRIKNSYRQAFRASTQESRYSLNHLTILGVTEGDAGRGSACPPPIGADGVSLFCEATGTIENFLIEGGTCGAAFDRDDRLQLKNGRIRGVTYGICGGEPDLNLIPGVKIEAPQTWTPFANGG